MNLETRYPEIAKEARELLDLFEKRKTLTLPQLREVLTRLTQHMKKYDEEIIDQNPEIPQVHLIYLGSMILATNKVKDEIRLRIKCN